MRPLTGEYRLRVCAVAGVEPPRFQVASSETYRPMCEWLPTKRQVINRPMRMGFRCRDEVSVCSARLPTRQGNMGLS